MAIQVTFNLNSEIEKGDYDVFCKTAGLSERRMANLGYAGGESRSYRECGWHARANITSLVFEARKGGSCESIDTALAPRSEFKHQA